jgi:hypothetical protein
MRGGENCGNCNAFQAGANGEGVCRARPPTAIMVGIQQMPGIGLLKSGPQMQQVPVFQGVFPPMRASSWCRDWQPIAKTITEAA